MAVFNKSAGGTLSLTGYIKKNLSIITVRKLFPPPLGEKVLTAYGYADKVWAQFFIQVSDAAQVADLIVDSNNYISINDAVSAIGSAAKTLIVSSSKTLTGNLTIPITLSLVILKGGMLVKASSYTLAINGSFHAGRYQVFSGFSGSDVTFGKDAIEMLCPEWLGVLGDDSTDNSSALSLVRACLAANSRLGMLVGPGTYAYATSPNWAIEYLQIIGRGRPVFKCTGTGDAFSIDGGSGSTAGPTRVRIEGLDIQGNNSASNVIYVRNVHHGVFKDARIVGGATAGYGIKTEWIVAWKFDKFTISANEPYVSLPQIGMHLGRSGAGLTTAYCTFIDTIIEGLSTGIYLDYADGNIFLGGTSEGNSAYGVNEQSTCTGNLFQKMDLEVNTSADALIRGRGSGMINCDTNSITRLYGAFNFIRGGFHEAITVETGAVKALLEHLEYNRSGGASVITDGGTDTRIMDCRDANGTYLADQYANPTAAFAGQSVGSSPYTYANPYKRNLGIIVRGGTVSQIDLIRGATTTDTGVTAGVFELSPGDSIKVTYSDAPEMVKLPRN